MDYYAWFHENDPNALITLTSEAHGTPEEFTGDGPFFAVLVDGAWAEQYLADLAEANRQKQVEEDLANGLI